MPYAYVRVVQAAGPRARVCARQTGESGGYVPELHSNTIYMIYNVPSAPKIKACTLEYLMCGNTMLVHDSTTCGCAE